MVLLILTLGTVQGFRLGPWFGTMICDMSKPIGFWHTRYQHRVLYKKELLVSVTCISNIAIFKKKLNTHRRNDI